jgi:hypothetical protein
LIASSSRVEAHVTGLPAVPSPLTATDTISVGVTRCAA